MRLALILSWLGVFADELSFISLRVPIFKVKPKPKREYFQALENKICSRMSQWQGHSLSMVGRVTLIKFVVVSMLSHSFSTYFLRFLNQVCSWVQNFI